MLREKKITFSMISLKFKLTEKYFNYQFTFLKN